MTEFLLVRHGQSVWNAMRRWQGQADPPLSSLGREQAAAAGEHLTAWPAFDAIASSNLDRAATTASIIASALGHHTVHRNANIAERDVGEWSGLTREDIEARYPGYLRQQRRPPGFESDDHFLERVRTGLIELAADVPGDRILAVAHGGLAYCLEGSVGRPFEHMPNLGALSVTVDDGQLEVGDRYDLLIEFTGEQTTSTVL